MTLGMLPSVSLETKTLDRTFLRCDLPTANEVLSEFKKEMLAVVAAMCHRTRFECLLDGVVAAIYPDLLRPPSSVLCWQGSVLALDGGREHASSPRRQDRPSYPRLRSHRGPSRSQTAGSLGWSH